MHGRIRGCLPGSEANDCRLDFGWRIKRLGRDLKQFFDLTLQLCEHTEAAPFFTTRFRSEALYHFQLQHEVHVLDGGFLFE